MGNGLALPDVLVIVAVMAAVTWLGHRLSGGIESRRGLFEADGTLPWWAVSASILATLVSAVTFVAVPAAVFAPGGDLTYLQVIIGLALGKVAVALLLARAYYEAQGANTCYEYIGQRIDRPTGEISMYLGLLLTLINSGVKLLTASLVLDVITAWGLPACALTVVSVGVLWSVLAGIKTVIWTDFVLFVLFSAAAVWVCVFIGMGLTEDLSHALHTIDQQAKWVLFDFSTDPHKRYTIWAGVIGGVALNIAQGATQGTWQRVRACRSVVDARKAYGYASLFYVMHLVILALGLMLVLFYQEHPLPASVIAQLSDAPDRILPYFVMTELPMGMSGLLIAAIFAAAISTLDSALTETADLSITHLYARFVRPVASEAHYVFASRWCMVLWGGVFLAVALFFARYSADGLLELTFKLPNTVYAAIFGTIILARMGVGRFATVSVGVVVAEGLVWWMSAQGIAFFYWCPLAGTVMVGVVWGLERLLHRMPGAAPPA